MKKEILRANKGISMTDVIIAMLILTLFAGVIGNLYYQIALKNNLIHLNAIAVYYAVIIAEDIDRISYEEVTNELNNDIASRYKIPDYITITIHVENYNNADMSTKDIIKIVTIKEEYECFGETRQYELEKLKIKE